MVLEFRSWLLLFKDQDSDNNRLVGKNQVHAGSGNPDRLEGLRTAEGRKERQEGGLSASEVLILQGVCLPFHLFYQS